MYTESLSLHTHRVGGWVGGWVGYSHIIAITSRSSSCSQMAIKYGLGRGGESGMFNPCRLILSHQLS